MSIPALPPKNSTDWMAWATAIDTDARADVNAAAAYTAPGAAPGYYQKLSLTFPTLAGSNDPEPLYVESQRNSTLYRTFWLNEAGSPRCASLADEPALKVFGPAANTGYAGLVLQILNRWNGAGSQVHLWGMHTDGRARIGTAQTPAAASVVIGPTDPVPAGTPAGTLIFRTDT